DQLVTARSLWGQSFNGTANVSGNMTGVGNINTSAAPAGTIYTNNWFRSKGNSGWYSEDHGGGWYMSDNTWIRNFGGKDVFLSNKLSVNGNVGIGTTAPSHKLHVVGDIYTTTKVNINGIILEKDSNGDLKVNGNLYATGGISAYGTSSAGSGGGLSGSVLAWDSAIKMPNATNGSSDTTKTESSFLASAWSIKQLYNKVTNLEGGSAMNVSVSGSGNAVTSISKSGTTISVVKGSTFLTAHQSLAGYMKTETADAKYMYHSRNNIVSDLNSFATNGAAHIYEMNNVTNRPNSNSWIQVMNWGTGDSNYGFLLANDYSADGHMYFRQKIAGYWKSWKTIIDSSNIGSQSVNYAASAGSVAWTNVSGRPSTMKNPSALSWSGYSSGSYDGSAAKSIS
ncbi:shufflon system plasmid conjugative transfer pilus tip adhesin PilV, partial [Prevotella copri]|uniref:shufflon system plasmid conjugative transfer pilus tip adhesin PilV n=1 Tax=Segatella copri TaxID=165179 RepID=UPI001C387C26